MSDPSRSGERTGLEIAVIGMAGRFPGAENVREFWRNLRGGVESITFFSHDELRQAGVPAAVLADPDYVPAHPTLGDVAGFDADFFGFSPREAALIDPQQRLFLECCWQAMEDAGYQPERVEGLVGVYAGSWLSQYLLNNLLFNPDPTVSPIQLETSNEKDYVATRVAYKLDLGGPSVNVESACSTSLLAVHLACQGLLSGECDMALAGGVHLFVPQNKGYLYRDGGHLSPDGRCRTFDKKARGTIFGSGLGSVVLKRLENALEDGDAIRAVILGTATNNDGAAKVGFAAPSFEGQSRVIRAAHTVAGVDPETIGYVLAHGTATQIGDPIEVKALTRAFRARTDKAGFCATGSIKPNVGHLGSAAGIANLIATVLSIENGEIPPSLNFEEPNPEIDFPSSPFFVQTELGEFPGNGAPRRAGVSAFGIGGANTHAVLEQAPDPEASGPSRRRQLIVLSARSSTALDAVTSRLAGHLNEHPELGLADVAYTLQVGRRPQRCRRILVASDRDDALAALESRDPRRLLEARTDASGVPVSFLFSGQGSQYAGMGAGLYHDEATFRQWIDRGAEALEPHLGLDLRTLLSPAAGQEEEAGEALRQTHVTQPALFLIEYALARQWMEWGIHPESMIGHSIGEYVAACLAEVFSFDDALALVAARGRLMQSVAPGSMLGVSLPAAAVEARLDERLSLAATNAPERSVVSGPAEAVGELERRLTADGVVCRPLHTSHAFHSAMMDPILDPFLREVHKVGLQPPRLPYLSNLTGSWIRDDEATDPEYWVRHLRGAVRFSEGLEKLYAGGARVLLEVGPGRTLRTLAHQHPGRSENHQVVSSLPHPKERGDDLEFVLSSLGDLWMSGVRVDWKAFSAPQRRRRVPLPTYPFEHRRFWIDPNPDALVAKASPVEKNDNLAEWFYVAHFKPSPLPLPFSAAAAASEKRRWLFFDDEAGLGEALARRLEEAGHSVVHVRPGHAFRPQGEGSFALRPGERQDYEQLIGALAEGGNLPCHVAHLWTFTADPGGSGDAAAADLVLEHGFYSLLALAQALGKHDVTQPVEINVVTNGLHAALRHDPVWPEKAAVLGPCKVIPREYPNVVCRSLDLGGEAQANATLVDEMLDELGSPADPDPRHQVIAYRDGERRVQAYEPVVLDHVAESRLPLRQNGVYLITGGLGGLGLVFARHLAETYGARLVLTGRSALPQRDAWQSWIDEHGPDDGTSRKIAALRALEDAGAETLVCAADVTDAAAMREVISTARQRFGVLHGVVHAAGIAGGGMIQLKSRDVAAGVLAAKVQGTRALVEVLGDEPLEMLVLCSSVASMLGGLGQVDYCAANNVLDAYAQCIAARRPDVFVQAVNWGPWEEIGMAVNTDLPQLGRSAAVPRSAGTAEPPAGATVHPLLGRVAADAGGRTIFQNELRVEDHWILSDHRILGTPAIPGTTYLEIARAAYEHVTGRADGVEIYDVLFFTPMMVPEGTRRQIQTVFEVRDDGYEFRVVSRTETGGEVTQHCLGRLRPFEPRENPRRWDHDELAARCPHQAEVDGSLHLDGSPVEWGDRWQSLRRVYVGEEHGMARLEHPAEFAADLDVYAFHPALFDIATSLSAFGSQEFYLPLTYGTVRIHRRLPGRFYAYLYNQRFQTATRDMVTADLALFDEQGNEVVEVVGFTQKRVGQAAERLERQDAPAESAAAPPAAGSSAPWIEPQAERTTKDSVNTVLIGGGILPAEGVEALRRTLSRHRGAQIVATCKNLLAQLEELGRPRRQDDAGGEAVVASKGARHERPTNLRSPYAPPRTDLESDLVALWQELLQIEQIGVHDNFYELGGDSVLGIQVVARARQKGLEFSPNLLFEHLTIGELAMAISGEEPAGEETGGAEALLAVEPEARSVAERQVAGRGEIEDVFPLTPLQQGLVLETLEAPEAGLYVEVEVDTHRLDIDHKAFELAWKQLVARHPALRTAIVHDGLDAPLQVVFRDVEIPFEYHDWSSLGAEDQAEKLAEFRRREAARGFDLSQPPLLRVSLHRLAPDSHVMIWSRHHAITDGWSALVIHRELLSFYRSHLEGQAFDAGAARPYRDFVAWLARQDLAAAEDFWRRSLAGFSRPNSFAALVPAAGGRADRRQKVRSLSNATGRALDELARQRQMPLNSVVQGAWALVLGHLGSADDVVYGVTVSGRPAELPDVETIVGLFINTLPMRVEIDSESPLTDFLDEVQKRQADVLRYSSTPLARIQAWSEVEPGVPLFETSFQFWNFPGLPEKLEERRFQYDVKTHYPLLVRVIPGDRMVLEALYDRRRMSDGAAELLLKQLETLLTAFSQTPDAKLADLEERLEEGEKQEQSEKAKQVANAAREKLRRRRRQRTAP